MALQLLAWQAWRGPSLWDWVARHGRSRKVWLFFRWKARQAALRWARIPRLPMTRQARHPTLVPGGNGTAGSATSGMVGQSRQDWQGSLGLLWLGRQCSEARGSPRPGRHDTEPSAPTAGMASLVEPTHGRQGVASLEGKQRQARPRWPANAWKERQARRDRSVRARCACRGRHRHFCQTAA